MSVVAGRSQREHLIRIGEVVRPLREEFPDISISKIRFIEDEGLLSPQRTRGGYRLFGEEDVERLSQIVRALLLLSQAESGQLALQKTHLDLAAALADVVDQFQIPFEAAKVRLVSSLAECTAWVDRVQIERMVSNLLSNALKFTAAGGEVRVGLKSDNGSVEISVEDTGCGIPTDHLPHIFDRFYRVRNAQTNSPRRISKMSF